MQCDKLQSHERSEAQVALRQKPKEVGLWQHEAWLNIHCRMQMVAA